MSYKGLKTKIFVVSLFVGTDIENYMRILKKFLQISVNHLTVYEIFITKYDGSTEDSFYITNVRMLLYTFIRKRMWERL